MIDRENVIDGIERLRFFNQRAGRELWGDKPAEIQNHDIADADSILANALALLKETEEGIPPIESTVEQKKFADRIGFAVSEFWCGACHFNLFNHPKYCPNCGKKVKWDD